MKSFKKKGTLDYQIRKVKKGTCKKLEAETMKQDQRAEQIWDRWKEKYSYKGSDKE